MATAKIIADSISESGIRITTLELEFERFLLAQFNTHRQFSRSAQSSRAIPNPRLIAALNKSSTPVFRESQPGMQAGVIINEYSYAGSEAKKLWIEAKNYAIFYAKELDVVGVAKEITNRLVEPFATVKVVITATEWDNFFALRLHHAAQPEMQELAQAMKTAIDESKPELLSVDDYHLPYVDDNNLIWNDTDTWAETIKKAALISAARCARVSYLNHDNSQPDIEKDLELAQRLLEVDETNGIKIRHLSPFEHQAKPIGVKFVETGLDCMEIDGITHIDKYANLWSANFRGWIQHRQLVDL
jgi:thymidylate synthase ThyX